jgi:hypothetical protein
MGAERLTRLTETHETHPGFFLEPEGDDDDEEME